MVRRGFKDALSKNLISDLNTLASWLLKPKQVPPLDGAQVVLFVEPDGTCCCRLVLATEAIPFEIYSGPRKLDTKKAIDKLQSNHEKETLTRP